MSFGNIILSAFLFGAVLVAIVAVCNMRSLLKQNTKLMQDAIEREAKMQKLHLRLFIDCIEFYRILYEVEYAVYYRDDHNSDYQETSDQIVEDLLVKYGFGTPDWNERSFRSAANANEIYNVVISLKIRP